MNSRSPQGRRGQGEAKRPGGRAQARKLKAQRMRQRRRRRIAIAAALAAAVVLIAAGILFARRPAPERPVDAAPVETVTAAPVETAAAVPTAAPTPEPTPEPTPTAVPGDYPDVVSFYRPEGKPYSPRIRMGSEYSAKWKKGEDIGSFEVIASDAERLEGDFFGDIFGAAWKAHADADRCHIGYTLRYALEDGSEIRYTMLSPEHIEHTEYLECWLYDDYHRQPHKSYSHIKTMKDDTLITSIKLTCGKRIGQVTEIWLTAFIYASSDELDADRQYTGSTSATLHITRR